MPLSDRSNSSLGSGRPQQRRRKSPVSMYRMDYNVTDQPKTPPPLVRLEPKKTSPKATKPKAQAVSRTSNPAVAHNYSSSSFSTSVSGSSCGSEKSTSTSSLNSHAGSSRSALSFSLVPRMLGKRFRSSSVSTTISESPTTPTSISTLPSARQLAEKITMDTSLVDVPEASGESESDTVMGDLEIVEVRRELPPVPKGPVTSQTQSRRTSLTPPIKPALDILPERRPVSPDLPSPTRPSRSSKRPKTAPSRSLSSSFSPSIPTDASTQIPTIIIKSPDTVPRPSTADTRRNGSLASSILPTTSTVVIGPRPDSPFIDSTTFTPQSYFSDLTPDKSAPPLTFSRRERGQGWSGEWNRGDMREVIQRLRQLK
ncbi:hypothetical protein D9757_011188 [Collybiopsis confluens]|uniref:Uncharacterized protein n=1 Tax=Collybiopsis confluens TaxID=2823264 RepID=A0A8H5M063_9AGAR|nr:hypothetical protein D9757_011188 [Collybiopsis confluens]